MYRVFTVAAERFKPRGVIARSCLFRSSSHNIGPCRGRADSMGKTVPFHRSVRVSQPFEDSNVSTTDSMGKSRFHSRCGKKPTDVFYVVCWEMPPSHPLPKEEVISSEEGLGLMVFVLSNDVLGICMIPTTGYVQSSSSFLSVSLSSSSSVASSDSALLSSSTSSSLSVSSVKSTMP